MRKQLWFGVSPDTHLAVSWPRDKVLQWPPPQPGSQQGQAGAVEAGDRRWTPCRRLPCRGRGPCPRGVSPGEKVSLHSLPDEVTGQASGKGVPLPGRWLWAGPMRAAVLRLAQKAEVWAGHCLGSPWPAGGGFSLSPHTVTRGSSSSLQGPPVSRLSLASVLGCVLATAVGGVGHAAQPMVVGSGWGPEPCRLKAAGMLPCPGVQW